MQRIHNLLLSCILLLIIIVIGTAGYVLIEQWPILDSFYMTVVTLSTVGFGEVRPLSEPGRLFTAGLIITGTGILAYSVGSLVQFMVEGKFKTLLGIKKMRQQIDKLNDHYIICGYGRIGKFICQEFKAHPMPFVVVEHDPERCSQMHDADLLYVKGDATYDSTLIKAGIERARGLITAVTSDTDNVYITLSARGLNPSLFILSRAGEESIEKKLMRAGATKVISPYTIGASRMAQAVLRPSVVEFIDIATGYHHLELQIEEISIARNSILAGKTLMDSAIRSKHNIIIVAIRKNYSDKMIFNPSAQSEIEAGDTLIVLGEPQSIKVLEQQAG